MNGQALWYLTRGSGIVSLILLTLAVLAGVTTSTRWAAEHWPRFVVRGLHRNLSLLSVVFVAIHIISAIVDGYVPIRVTDAVIPFASAYKPFWLGLGALSLDVYLAVAVTSLARDRMGHRAWRRVHWLAYACWGLAIAHSMGIGSDRNQGWMLALDATAVASVVAATAWRTALGLRQARRRTSRRPARLSHSTA